VVVDHAAGVPPPPAGTAARSWLVADRPRPVTQEISLLDWGFAADHKVGPVGELVAPHSGAAGVSTGPRSRW